MSGTVKLESGVTLDGARGRGLFVVEAYRRLLQLPLISRITIMYLQEDFGAFWKIVGVVFTVSYEPLPFGPTVDRHQQVDNIVFHAIPIRGQAI